MSTAGLSTARLGRMHDVMAGYVERGDVPGLVTLGSRRGEVHVDVIGTQATADPTPMRRDTIFRISSMTKPITAAATMILVEECKLRLDEPVDHWLPERAARRYRAREATDHISTQSHCQGSVWLDDWLAGRYNVMVMTVCMAWDGLFAYAVPR